eukprot:6325208-Karenia_brevis.AAC.1
MKAKADNSDLEKDKKIGEKTDEEGTGIEKPNREEEGVESEEEDKHKEGTRHTGSRSGGMPISPCAEVISA